MALDRRQFCGLASGTLLAGAMSSTTLYSSLARAATSTASSGLTSLSLSEAAERIRNGSVSSLDLTNACFERIAIYEPQLNAFITLFKERALREAAVLDAERKAGKLRGPLHGIPVSLKDNIDTAGERTTGGAPFNAMRVPKEDSPPVARLRAAGAIIIGKNNMNELAMSDGQSSFYGRVRNPWSLDRATGGSSSGSCASVVADLVCGALGTDTGGSIRNPAAWCGNVGLKPTNGLVSNRGTIALLPSLDTTGPITKTVADAALLLTVIAGYDPLDITSVEHQPEDYVAALSQPVSKLRIGMLLGHFDRMEPDVSKAMSNAIDVLKTLVQGIRDDAVLPDGGQAMALMPFGETYALHEQNLKANRFLYSSVDQATLDSLAHQKAEDYIRARWEMDMLRREINSHFTDFDLVVFPTVHTVAPKLVNPANPGRDGARAPGALFDAGLFNVLGIPAISVPCGFSKEGLPIGMCIAGPRFSEGKILAVAHAYEQATSWHKRNPPLNPNTPVPPIPTV